MKAVAHESQTEVACWPVRLGLAMNGTGCRGLEPPVLLQLLPSSRSNNRKPLVGSVCQVRQALVRTDCGLGVNETPFCSSHAEVNAALGTPSPVQRS